ncbi:MAG: DUF2975 domain-containing protein [Alphaproteobacteria bacterium]|nr:DUF2975 domain-containing protein [Alphaproteobacteria bacterium]
MKFKHPYELKQSLATLSKILAIIFTATMIFDFIFEIAFWTFADLKKQTLFSMPVSFSFSAFRQYIDSFKILGEITPMMRFLGWIASLLSLSVLMYLYYTLSQLFSAFSKGYIFTLENISRIKKSSKALIVFMLLTIVTNSLLTLILSMNNPVGERYLGITVGTANLRDLVIALVIMVAAYVMEQGLELEEERQLTI